jgi:hypothetical protein
MYPLETLDHIWRGGLRSEPTPSMKPCKGMKGCVFVRKFNFIRRNFEIKGPIFVTVQFICD